MNRDPTIFDLISERRKDEFLEVLDRTFKNAAREGAAKTRDMGREVADGRAGEPLPQPFTSGRKP